MRKISKIKLSALNNNELSKREMHALHGGGCTCGCVSGTLAYSFSFGSIAEGGGYCGCGCSCGSGEGSAGIYFGAESGSSVHNET